MKKLKTVHIHTDYKFVDYGTICFTGDYFENTILVIDREDGTEYEGYFMDMVTLIKKDQFEKILQICKEADVVVFYALYSFQSKIALQLPKSIKLVWRLFGHELYREMTEYVYSEKTKAALKLEVEEPTREPLRSIKKIYRKIRYGKNLSLIEEAIERIDYMLILSREEYDFLAKYWKNLPKFIRSPHFELPTKELDSVEDALDEKQKKPRIIIGNNRNAYNNHLDILDLIDNSAYKENYEFVLLCNYGDQTDYFLEIKNKIKGKDYYTLIEDFIPLDEFLNFYENVDALVINGYRQMAVGNILDAFRNGVKVYLNKKNSDYTWFTNEGFLIGDSKDFQKDLERNNFILSYKEALQNINTYLDLTKKYPFEDFQRELYAEVLEIDGSDNSGRSNQ